MPAFVTGIFSFVSFSPRPAGITGTKQSGAAEAAPANIMFPQSGQDITLYMS